MNTMSDICLCRPPPSELDKWFGPVAYIVMMDVLAFAILVCLKLDNYLPNMSWYVSVYYAGWGVEISHNVMFGSGQ